MRWVYDLESVQKFLRRTKNFMKIQEFPSAYKDIKSLELVRTYNHSFWAHRWHTDSLEYAYFVIFDQNWQTRTVIFHRNRLFPMKITLSSKLSKWYFRTQSLKTGNFRPRVAKNGYFKSKLVTNSYICSKLAKN